MKTKHIFLLILGFFVLNLNPAQLMSASAQRVSFTTSDQVKLVGQFYKPATPAKLTFVLLHGLGSSKEEWGSFADFLSSKGYGVLIFDARGHNESNRKVSGESVSFQMFYGKGLSSEWGKMIGDFGSAVEFLKKNYGINSKMIVVGGASIGANIAFRYAAEKKDVPYVILLSPGIDYQGIMTNDVIKTYGARSLLVIASSGDRYAHQSSLELQFINNTLKTGKALMTLFVEEPTAGHGVQMFKREKPNQPSALEVKILKWIQAIK